MTIIERIAKKLGFVRPVAPEPRVTELIVFRSAVDAYHAGFHRGTHPLSPDVRAWWPGMGMRGLYGRPMQRVTMPSDMAFVQVEGEGSLKDILRKRQMVFGDNTIWIEL